MESPLARLRLIFPALGTRRAIVDQVRPWRLRSRARRQQMHAITSGGVPKKPPSIDWFRKTSKASWCRSKPRWQQLTGVC